jgi:hypothetical protein
MRLGNARAPQLLSHHHSTHLPHPRVHLQWQSAALAGSSACCTHSVCCRTIMKRLKFELHAKQLHTALQHIGVAVTRAQVLQQL